MTRKTPAGDSVNADLNELQKALQHSPGVYEVMRLYAQYQKVLDQARGYMIGPAHTVVGFSSSDRTG